MANSTWSQDLYIRAYRFAAQAHLGQTVPGTEYPYLMHVSLVSMEVMAAFMVTPGCDADLGVQCALLHDVIEDTQVSLDALKVEFGANVAAGVLALTKNPALPKAAQMQDSLERIRLQPREIWMVKLADRITNLQLPPISWTPEKILRYREEAEQILAYLGEANAFLAARLSEKISAY